MIRRIRAWLHNWLYGPDMRARREWAEFKDRLDDDRVGK